MQTVDQPLAPNPSIVFRAMGESGVLYHPESETYFSLNAVGVEVWTLLSAPTRATIGDIVAALCSRYPDVASERIDADVRALVESLVGASLVVSVRDGV